MSKLQEEFSQSVAQLILKAKELGYGITFGEAYREPKQAAADADAGIGIVRSLHCERLAIDLNVFRNGRWLTHGEDFTELGEWWCGLGPWYRWGGHFKSRPDGNHFSISPDGQRA